jgi:hypothetical protein
MQVQGDDRCAGEELVLPAPSGHGAIAEVPVHPLTIPTDAPIVSAGVAVMKRKGRALGVLPGSMRSRHRRAHHVTWSASARSTALSTHMISSGGS